jgi:hypothetical protein
MGLRRLARRGHVLRFLVLAMGLGAVFPSAAGGPVLAANGCPIFHCTPEATGVNGDPLLAHPTTVLSNNALGTLLHQGCSGDGARLACLFPTDAVSSGVGKGTLKLIDATTLQPIWGSAGVAGSYDIDPVTFSTAQAPLMFADGSLAAGDSFRHVLYSPTGQVLKSLVLGGRGSGRNMGMTPISERYGVVTQNKGTFTLVDMESWTKVSALSVTIDGVGVEVQSPSVGTRGVLYAVVASGSNRGHLLALAVETDQYGADKLVLRATFTFLGKPSASAVVVKPETTGLPGNLVVLYVPGLQDDVVRTNRLLGLLDDGTSAFSHAWQLPIVLDEGLTISPAIDEDSRSLFFRYATTPIVHRHDLLNGSYLEHYDLAAAGGFPASFSLNGHMAANRYAGAFTLLLSGAYKLGRRGGGSAQVALAFQPLISPTSVLWSRKIASQPDLYTLAWSTGPATNSFGYYCPIVVGKTSGITRICD